MAEYYYVSVSPNQRKENLRMMIIGLRRDGKVPSNMAKAMPSWGINRSAIYTSNDPEMDRKFIADMTGLNLQQREFCFSPSWGHSATEMCARIQVLLSYGIPAKWDYGTKYAS